MTPSFNQAAYLEQTIRSVLLQQYPALEYLVLDGGSTDGSPRIIEHYAPWLSFWRSAPDGGQSAAVADGFAHSSGDLLGWVNSDDLLLPGCLLRVGRFMAEHPDAGCVVGGTILVDTRLRPVRDRLGLPRLNRGAPETLARMLSRRGCAFYQPASFWRRSIYEAAGGLAPEFQFAMDFDLYLRMAQVRPFAHIDALVACLRLHGASKSSRLQAVRDRECAAILRRYGLGAPDGRQRLRQLCLRLDSFRRNLPLRLAEALRPGQLATLANN